MYVHSCFDPPGEAEHRPFGKSMTRQSETEGCDINVIMKRYDKTGDLPEGVEGFFADVSAVGSYQELQDRIAFARLVFYQLPASERAKHDNDVAKFLDFASDPKNVGELVSLGILPAEGDGKEPAAPAPAPGGGAAAPPSQTPVGS